MKIIWITNIPIGDMAKKLYDAKSDGLWMDALLKQFVLRKEHDLVLVTTGKVKNAIIIDSGRIHYYLLPGGIPGKYRRKAKDAENDWSKIYSAEKPDIIQIWGTEYKHALPAAREAKKSGIPMIVYIQGLMEAISRYCVAGMKYSDMRRYTTLRDIYRSERLISQRALFEKRAETEKVLLGLSGHCIIENTWAEIHCRALIPGIEIHKIPLSINKAFFRHDWSIDRMAPHTIMCNASGYPLKGLHIMLKALVLVKQKHDDVKLYVPGTVITCGTSFFSRQKRPGYWVYISDMINDLGLSDNVVFTGNLTQEELAERLSKVNIFVLTSSIENHSSSLKEAMAVGIPCIAASVGGVPEYFSADSDGFLYRFEEYEFLAEYICRLFGDVSLCLEFSERAKGNSRAAYSEQNIYDMTISAYEKAFQHKE